MKTLLRTRNTLQGALGVLVATAWLHGTAAFAGDATALDLKRISEGTGAKADPKAAIRWETNAKIHLIGSS